MQPFLWVLRFPPGNNLREMAEFLPEGFEDRSEGRGFVVRDWAPQVEIFSHPCTGGFMPHCGWNSLMEAVSSGIPVIACQMQLDQSINARLICEQLKLCFKVGRGEDGVLKREEICKAVRSVMVEEEGKHIRERAEEMGEIFSSKILVEDRLELYTDEYELCVV